MAAARLPVEAAPQRVRGTGPQGSTVQRLNSILLLGIMENQMETTIEYWGYIGIMEKKMETTIEYWGYIGIMEKKMETTIFTISAILPATND